MTWRYNGTVTQDQPLPKLWLFSDARNDAVLETALRALPPQSGFVFRHYHLEPSARRERFAALQGVAKSLGHRIILSGSAIEAKQWKADGMYSPAAHLPQSDSLLKLATAHDWPEIVAADRAKADGIFLSPVFATCSHPSAKVLGPVRFRMLAAKAKAPVIALGGMTHTNARRLDWPRWGAIDGLS